MKSDIEWSLNDIETLFRLLLLVTVTFSLFHLFNFKIHVTKPCRFGLFKRIVYENNYLLALTKLWVVVFLFSDYLVM